MNLPGFGADRYRKIAPYVTALPDANVKINICTASSPVLESLAPNLTTEYPPELLASGRKTGCFPDMPTLLKVVGPKFAAQVTLICGPTTSQYFRLTTRVTLGTTEFTLYSLLSRSGNKVTPLLRSFGTL